MTLIAKVGVCRFTYKLLEKFSVLEVQESFYDLIPMSRVEKWASHLKPGSEITLKVFQGITHESNSPTWRRYKGKDFEEIKEYVGSLKLNDITRKFWEQMFDLAKTISSKILVLQTPASFKPSEKNIRNVLDTFEFLHNLRSSYGAFIAWEPRGDWLKKEYEKSLKQLIMSFEWVVHTTDLLFNDPVEVKKILYFRLHGKPYLNYKYQYNREDYEDIVKKLGSFASEGAKEIYLLFNNVAMIKNAEEFKEYLNERGFKTI